MYRQIGKCIRIRMMQGKGALVLNKKEEYSRSILPQLEVSIGGKVITNQRTKEVNYTKCLAGQADNKEGGEEDRKRKNNDWKTSCKRRKIDRESNGESEAQKLDEGDLQGLIGSKKITKISNITYNIKGSHEACMSWQELYGRGRKRKMRLDHRSNKPRREVEDQGEKMMKKEEEDAM